MTDVIVGVDGSTASRAALRWAGAVSAAGGMTLRPLTAWEYPSTTGLPFGPTQTRSVAEMDAEARDRVRRVIEEELGNEASGGVEVEVGRGPAAGVLIERARRPNAGILVVGARGLGGFDGLLLGSVSQQCAEHAPCPVVIVRGAPERAASGPRTVIAGLDGSATSTSALRRGAQLARDAEGGRVVAIHAAGGTASAPLVGDAGRALEEWCEPLRSMGVDHESRVEGGDARSVLVDAAATADADLMVVGSRGLGPVRGLLLGSVAGYIVRYAPLSVAVVRPAADR
jgi:nucleotide-binding universal stress UspA family protein